MDLSKLGTDLQAAVDAVVKTTATLDLATSAQEKAAIAQRQAVATAQGARDSFTSALNEVVPVTPARKHIAG